MIPFIPYHGNNKTIEMENSFVLCYGWGELNYKGAAMGFGEYNDGTILYVNCGGAFVKTHKKYMPQSESYCTQLFKR